MLFVEVNNSAMKLVISSRTRFMFSNRVHSHTILPFWGMAKSEVSDLPCSICLLGPLFIALLPSNESFTLLDGLGKSALLWSLNQETSLEKKNAYGMVVVFKKCYFIRPRGTKEGQKCASRGHLEIFSTSSGERQRMSRGT